MANLNSIGLLLDIIGACLIFINSPEKDYRIFIFTKEENKDLMQKDKRSRRFARLGLAIIILGFILQYINTLI